MTHPLEPHTHEADYRYAEEKPDLSDSVEVPQYASVLDWMRVAESKAMAFDIWARGNYTRRLIHNRANGTVPILVPFKYVDELRWAYRRLALMGLPAEFIYTGELGATQKVLALHPGGKYMIDAGWGYIAALGSTTRMRGREWFPVTGFARRMPEPILDWLTEEVPTAFEQGTVFVAPADLIGIGSSDFDAGSGMLAEIQDGVVLSDSLKATEVIASMDLPHLDQLTSAQFGRLIQEHADDLVRFRLAIRKLVRGEGTLDSAIEEIAAEVAELRFADSQQRMRAAVSRFGGVFTTFAATVGATASIGARAPSAEVLLAAAGAATLAGATATLVELWKQASERRAKMREKKFSLFWSLGIQSPEAVKRRKVELSFHKYNRTTPALEEDAYDCHWLCPPTNGMRFLSVREKSGAQSGT